MADVKQYSAGRDFVSATKMNYTHHFLKQLTGWKLHPLIETHRDHRYHIGDMGTQTALWAVDIAEDPEVDAMVTAIDISEKFFPPPEWLPGNVTLRLHDILTPFPSDLLGTFDVVHFRLFITLTYEDLSQMVQNAVTLLKPGGYIQWVEHDKTDLKPITAIPGQDISTVEALINLEKNPFPNFDATWINTIAPTMTAKGLELIAEDRIQVRPSLLTQMNELHLLSLMDIPVGLSQAADEFKEKHFDALVEDSGKGISSVDTFIFVVARKP